ncbi:hypothetical protein C0995_010461 [Termitomyces sp. Mi166|nr:hypothetical protein C0995_010461 [Termitomyces sp. Mi166\
MLMLIFGQYQRAALENIATVLKAAGSGLEHIVKVNIYLTDLPRDFAPMNEIYIQISSQRAPALELQIYPLGPT